MIFLTVYADDFLICSKTLDEHLEHLKKVFMPIKKTILSHKMTKCSFESSKVKLLGQISIGYAMNRTFNGNKRNNYRMDCESYRFTQYTRRKKSIILGELFRKPYMDCGKKNHKRDDLNCKNPSFASLQIRGAKDRHNED